MSDPYHTLGIARDADDASVRAAYLAAVQLCPPDRDAERFSSLRTAFETLATHRLRLAHDLFSHDPPTLDGMLHMLESQCLPHRPNVTSLLRVLKGSHDGR